MTTLEPSCLFCSQRLTFTGSFSNDLYPLHGGTGLPDHYSFECEPCQSEQMFLTTGKLLDYNFRVGPYVLWFFPGTNKSTIAYREILNQVPVTRTVLVLNFLPDLTPQNTTEERIQTLILFS